MTLLSPRILIVEDDAKIADMVANYLHMHGFRHTWVGDGVAAVHAVRTEAPDLMLLDLMIPGIDGVQVCRQVREFSMLPIIMVTARVDEIDRLLGLDVGADDYVCKPFSPRELVARVKALLRRSIATQRPAAPPTAQDIQIDSAQQRICWRGYTLTLTSVEFRLLSLFVARPHHIFSRAQLLDHLHHDFRDVSDRAIDSHIKNLRRKLEQVPLNHDTISSVYGVGYRFEPLPSTTP